jgi:micrococcal nuclease
MKRCCAVIWLCCSCNMLSAEEFSARVIAVLDGDTVLALHDGERVKLRLANIDAPEMNQEFGPAAKLSLADLVLLKPVRATVSGMDKYQRKVAILAVDDHNINEEQVRRGMAWASAWRKKRASSASRESTAAKQNLLPADSSAPNYVALQREARTAGRGLWALNHPIPPWRWRKTHPATLPAR